MNLKNESDKDSAQNIELESITKFKSNALEEESQMFDDFLNHFRPNIENFANSILSNGDILAALRELINFISYYKIFILKTQITIDIMINEFLRINFKEAASVLYGKSQQTAINLILLIHLLSNLSNLMQDYLQSLNVFELVCAFILNDDGKMDFPTSFIQKMFDLLNIYYTSTKPECAQFVYNHLSEIAAFFDEEPLIQFDFLKFVCKIPIQDFQIVDPEEDIVFIMANRLSEEITSIYDETIEELNLDCNLLKSLSELYRECLHAYPTSIYILKTQINELISSAKAEEFEKAKVDIIMLITEFNIAISKVEKDPDIKIKSFLKNYINPYVVRMLGSDDPNIITIMFKYVYSLCKTMVNISDIGIEQSTFRDFILSGMNDNNLEQKVMALEIILAQFEKGDFTWVREGIDFEDFFANLSDITSLGDSSLVKLVARIILMYSKYARMLGQQHWFMYSSFVFQVGIVDTLEEIASSTQDDIETHTIVNECLEILMG